MTATRRLILALDCGSSSFKAALHTDALERLAEAAVAVPYSRQGGAEVELPAAGVLDTFAAVTRAVCDQAGLPQQAITDIALDSQAQTFALCSAAGQALTPFYSWMDCRAESAAAEVAAHLGTDFHRHCSFAPPIPQLQLCKMRWLHRHQPASVAGAAALALLPGFIARHLGVPNTTDRNLAAMGGAFSLLRADWWAEALALTGLSAAQMPQLVEVGATVTASLPEANGAFRPGIKVTFAGNDQTAGAFGNGCDQGGMVITLGTALVVYRHAGSQPGPYNPGGCWGPYPGGSYYELGTIDQGCQALDWARQRLSPALSATEVDAAAQRVMATGRQGLAPLFVPARIAAGEPWLGPCGDIDLQAYAVLEGIAFALRRLVEVNLHSAQRAQTITAIGGGSRSDVWLELIAAVLGTPVVRGTGDALLGAAAMALGRRQGPAPRASRLFLPGAGPAAGLDERYQCWLARS